MSSERGRLLLHDGSSHSPPVLGSLAAFPANKLACQIEVSGLKGRKEQSCGIDFRFPAGPDLTLELPLHMSQLGIRQIDQE